MPHWPKPWGRDAGADRAARHRAGVRAPPASSARPTASPAGSSSRSSSTPPTTRSPAGCARRSTQERDLVPAVQRARRRVRRGRHQDQGHPGRRRLAGQRPEGVDQRRPRAPASASPRCAPTPTCPKHDGITTMVIDMHAEGVEVRPLKMADRRLGVQRGVLQRRVRARRRRRRAGRRRLDGRPGHARQREREHRRRPGRHGAARRRARSRRSTPTPSASPAAPAAHRPLHRRAARRWALLNLRSANRAVAGGEPGPGGRRSPSSCCPRSATRRRRSWPSWPAPTPPSSTAPARMSGMLVLMHRGHVDRRRHVGDQAQPDRRAHPRPAPRPADQLTFEGR